MQPENWWEYVKRISDNAPAKAIAAAAGVDASQVTRWKEGQRPNADTAVAFARRYKVSPVVALIAADYLRVDEVTGAVEIHASVSDLSTNELLHEIGLRFAAWHEAEGWAPGWGDGSQQPPAKGLLRGDRPRVGRRQYGD